MLCGQRWKGAGPACWIISRQRQGLLGLDGLDWFDVSAPVGETQKTYTYEEGAQFVLSSSASSAKIWQSLLLRPFESAGLRLRTVQASALVLSAPLSPSLRHPGCS